MNNNDILKRLRYAFDFKDTKMIQLFALADYEVNPIDLKNWMKKEDDPDFKSLYDKHLAIFLNGFINDRRGKREGEQPKPEQKLNNNLILRKLKIALNLRDDDMVEILDLADFVFSKHEMNAFFRKPGQRQYRECKDQILRNFILGLQKKYRKV